MSYIIILRINADRDALERAVAEHGDALPQIEQASKEAGAIHHAFYSGEDGRVVVIDEWGSPEAFQKFFAGQQDKIGPLMAAAGVQGQPQLEIYEKLDTGDAF